MSAKKRKARKSQPKQSRSELLAELIALRNRKAHDDAEYERVLKQFKIELQDRNRTIAHLQQVAPIGRAVEQLISEVIAYRLGKAR